MTHCTHAHTHAGTDTHPRMRIHTHMLILMQIIELSDPSKMKSFEHQPYKICTYVLLTAMYCLFPDTVNEKDSIVGS